MKIEIDFRVIVSVQLKTTLEDFLQNGSWSNQYSTQLYYSFGLYSINVPCLLDSESALSALSAKSPHTEGICCGYRHSPSKYCILQLWILYI